MGNDPAKLLINKLVERLGSEALGGKMVITYVKLRNNKLKQLKTDHNKKNQMITMFLSKISEDIEVIHSKLYVRFHIIKPASEKCARDPTLRTR
jgi:hypothetical protein